MIEPNILAFQNADLLQAIETPPEGGWTKGALAAHFDRDHSNLNKTLKVLAGEGMVVAGELTLTEAGKAQLGAFQRARGGVGSGDPAGSTTAAQQRCAIEKLQRNPLNRPINPAHVADIADTASAEGVGDIIVPILVSPADAHGVRTIWAGEHRWEAVKKLQAEDRLPPALEKGIRFDEREATPGEAAVIALIENSSRTDLTPWQDALQLKAAADGLNLNASELARRIGRAREGSRGGLRDVQVKLKVAREAKPHDIAAYEADPKAPGAWERLRDSVTERGPEPVLTKAQRLALAELFARADQVIGAEVRVLPTAHTAEGARLAQYGLAILIRDDKGDRAKVTQAGADHLKAEDLSYPWQMVAYAREKLGFPAGWGTPIARTEWLNLPTAPAPAKHAPDPEVTALQGIEAVAVPTNEDRETEARLGLSPGSYSKLEMPDPKRPNAMPWLKIEIGHVDKEGWLFATSWQVGSDGGGYGLSFSIHHSKFLPSRIEALRAARVELARRLDDAKAPGSYYNWLNGLDGGPIDLPHEIDPLVVNGVRYPNLTRANEARRIADGGGPVNGGSRPAAPKPGKSLVEVITGLAHVPDEVDSGDFDEDAVQLICAERRAHLYREGYSDKHDDVENAGGELADAAAAYAVAANGAPDAAHFWPGAWDPSGFKPTATIGDLVKAGALILAEIERRLRAGETA